MTTIKKDKIMTPQEFRAWRKRHKLTQAKAGEWLGVTRKTVNIWENGKSDIPRAVMLANKYIDHLWGKYPV